jgi:hypothetical protein
MYAKINNGVVEKFPYSIGELRKDHSNKSLPRNIPDEWLPNLGMVPVHNTQFPSVDYTKNVAEETPVFNDAAQRWERVWNVTDATAEEVAERVARQANEIRAERNQKLDSSDWTQLPDSATRCDQAAWAAYRQQLADITQQEGFPWNVTWPTQPA